MSAVVPLSATGKKDWIDGFLDYTQDIPSPEIFRLWSAIAAIAGALERRAWMVSAGEPLFPNLYTLLVGHPGSGKTQAIKRVNDLWYSIPALHKAPHDVTKAALIDRLLKASQKHVIKETSILEYHSLLVAADEFGVLLPSHDTDFLSTLNRIYDNPRQHQQERRGLGSNQIDIINPQFNILAGTQPSYLANLLPEEAWGQGFMSRVIMIHSSSKIRSNIFSSKELDKGKFSFLSSRLTQVTRFYGQIRWDYNAGTAAQKWNEEGMPPEPEHSKLEHYNSRRILHLLKLCMISSVSSNSDTVTLSDFERAKTWLLDAEERMPDVFREMLQRSDIQVIDELHFYLWKIWAKTKKPIHQARLFDFLKNRVPSEKVQRIIDIMIKANIIDFQPPEHYVPRAKNEHGME